MINVIIERVCRSVYGFVLVSKMASADDSFKIEKLTAENYHSWKFNIKMSLIDKDLWEIVQKTEISPEDASAEEQQKFKKRENLALASVCL